MKPVQNDLLPERANRNGGVANDAGEISVMVDRGKTQSLALAASGLNRKRLRLLRTGSALAAAVSLAGLLASPAAAQMSPGAGVAPTPRTIIFERPVENPRPKRPGSPIMSRPEVPRISLQSQSAPVRLLTPDDIRISGNAALDPPVIAASSSPRAGAPPMVADIRITAPADIPPSSAPQPTAPVAPPDTIGLAPSGVSGINVLAHADFDPSTIGFRPGDAADIVSVNAAEAIINWTTFGSGTAGSQVTFLGEGSTLAFTSGLANYTVLNRVFTPDFDSAIRIDGSVTSTIAGGATGGNVWFYSPGGIIAGSTSVFDVGSLVLTTSQLDAIGAGGRQMQFGGVTAPDSAITIEQGAMIGASDYAALVAPRIEQHGTVSAKGSVAYVAAEQAQLTIDNGLFDIVVTLGSEDANGLVHSGTTTGGAAASGGNPRAMQMVGVSKNAAMTMLVGGSLGYQAATGASVGDNGQIILTAGDRDSIAISNATLSGDVRASAGKSIRFGAANGARTAADGDVSLHAGVEGVSGGAISVLADGGVDIAGTLSLDTSVAAPGPVGRGNIAIAVEGAGSRLSIGGDLVIDASTAGAIDYAAADTVSISVQDSGASGGLLVGGDIAVDTSAAAGSDAVTTRAGGVTLAVKNGQLGFSRMQVDSRASASGAALGQTGSGRDYQGGDFSLIQGADAAINGQALTVNSSAAGVDGKGGRGAGGAFVMQIDGGELSIDGIDVTSVGIGGNGERAASSSPNDTSAAAGFSGEDFQRSAASRGNLIDPEEIAMATGFPSAGDGGDGVGGSMTFNLSSGTANVTDFSVNADGIGSDGASGGGNNATNGGAGGDGLGGTAIFNATGGTLNVANTLSISASGNTVANQGSGGAGSGTDGGAGGRGFGGVATFNLDGAATITAGDILVDARAFGGAGGDSSIFFFTLSVGQNPADGAGAGGDAFGGTATFNDTAGSLSFTNLVVAADAIGGAGGNAQSGNGVVASVGGDGGNAIAGDAIINLNRAINNNSGYFAIARAGGGAGGNGDIAGSGGDATGGLAAINVNNVAARVDSTFLSAFAAAGAGGGSILAGGMGGAGGTATGGTAALTVDGTNGDFSTISQTALDATAVGGDGGAGGATTVDAFNGGVGGSGGAATGGTIQITVSNGAAANIDIGTDLDASASGGDGGTGGGATLSLGGNGGIAGTGTGGEITLEALDGGQLDIAGASLSLLLNATGVGGAGGTGGIGIGGSALPGLNAVSRGGSVNLVAQGGGSTFNFGGNLIVDVSAQSSADTRAFSAGAAAIGGDIVIDASLGGTFSSAGDLTLDASAAGGSGEQSNGEAIGGSIDLTVANGVFNLGTLSADVSAAGGSSAAFEGATGGDGGGGAINLVADAGSSFGVTTIDLVASGTGGDGAIGSDGVAGGAGGVGAGGEVTANLAGDPLIGSFAASVSGTGGSGGDGGDDGAGGDGGAAFGGIVTTTLAGTGAIAPLLSNYNVDASATGGSGGTGGAEGGLAAGNGGAGGSAIGGSASFSLSGTGATFDIDPLFFVVLADANGGSGGDGGLSFSDDSGAGGAGGNGAGGSITFEAQSGTTLTILQSSSVPASLSVSGFGGAGGLGGAINVSAFGIAGSGGAGGIGTGGSPILRASGGTITSADFDLFANGIGGAGGLGGSRAGTLEGASGAGGGGVGGTPSIETLDGSPGIVTLDNLQIFASGAGGNGSTTGTNTAGHATIIDGSIDPLGLISLGSLTVSATGAPAAGSPSLTISSHSGAISVTGDVNANVAGDIIFDFDGDGQIVVGNRTTLDAGGTIAGTHTGNTAGLSSIDTALDTFITAGADVNFSTGFVSAAGRDTTVIGNSVTFGDLDAVRDLVVTAATGSITGSGDIFAGRDIDFDAMTSISIRNGVSDRSININAGTSIVTGDLTIIGNDTLGAERIDLIAGGNITVGDVDAIDALAISGADLTAGLLDGQTLVATMTGAVDIAAAISEQTIDITGASVALANGDAVQNITLDAIAGGMTLGTVNSERRLVANATGDIDFTDLTGLVVTLGSGGNITGGTAAADRNIVSGVSRNVNLTATGSVDIDSASAVADIVVNADSFTATSLVTSAGTSSDINIVTPGAINIGTLNSAGSATLSGSTVTLGDGTAVAATSTITSSVGGVNIGTFDTNTFFDIVSATTVDFGTLTARAMSITADGNVTGTRAASDVTLISGRPRNVAITTNGAVNVAQIDTVADIVISGASVDADLYDAGGNINVAIGGLADILQTNSGGATTVTGASVLIGDGVSSGLGLLTSTVGDVDIGTWDANGFFDIDSAQNVTFDSVSGRVVDIVAAGDITGNSAATDVALISGRVRDVTLDAGGVLQIGSVNSINGIGLTAASINAGTLTANAAINVAATGAAEVDDIQGGSNVTVTGADVTLIDGTIALGLTANASAGDLAINGTVNVGRNINLDAAGNINFGTLGTTNGNLDANAAGDIVFTSASANIDTSLIAGGLVDGDVVNGRIVTINASRMDIGALTATFSTDLDTSVGDLLVGTLNSPGTNNLLSARQIQLGDVSSGSFIADAATEFVVQSLRSTGNIADITISAGTSATYSSIDADRLLSIDAQTINGGRVNVDASLDFNAGTINVGDIIIDQFGNIIIATTTGSLTVGEITNGNIVDYNSAGALTAGIINAVNTNLTSAGDAVLADINTGIASLNIGGNLDAASIIATSASPGATVIVTGDADIASLDTNGLATVTVGGALTGGLISGGVLTRVQAGSVDFGTIASTGGQVQVTATNAALIGTVNSATSATVTGTGVTLDSGTIGTSLTLNATAGNIAGAGNIAVANGINLDATGNIGFGTLSAGTVFTADAGGSIAFTSANSGDTLTFNAAGSIDGGGLTATNTVTLSGNSIAVGDVIAGAIDLTSATDILFDLLQSPSSISLTAAGGQIGANTGNGDIDSEGDITLSGQGIALGIVDAVGNLTVDATAGDAVFARTISTGATALTATGSISVDHADVGGNFSAIGGGDFTSGLNSIITGGDIVIAAGGAVSLGNSNAGGLIDVQATQIDFASLGAGATVDLAASGAINGGTIGADGSVTLDGATIAMGDLTTLGDVIAATTLGDAAFGNIDAVGGVTINAKGTPTIAGLTTGANANITGADIALGASDIGGGLTLGAQTGSILLQLDGNEQIFVGGGTTLNAAQNIVVTHTNNTGGVLSLDTANGISAAAFGGNIDAQAGSILSGTEILLFAGGAVSADDLRATAGIAIGAGGNVTLNNAAATGPQGVSNFRGITIDAGLNPFGGVFYDNLANVQINGTVDSYADVTMRAGGNVTLAPGSAVVADDSVLVQTGDDIILAAGASLTSGRNPSIAPDPTDPFNGLASIILDAGGITNLLSVPATPIASIVVGGTLNAHDGAIIASANAIDGLNADFIASSIALDINDAPAAGGAQSNDLGLLSANCLEGNVCIGNIQANNVIEIGQASNNDVIQLIIEQGSVNANDILITTRNDIVMGTSGIATALNASNLFSAQSTSGDVNLFDTAIASDQIIVSAAGSLLGTASLTSTGDIGISVGGDINAASIIAGGELTSAAAIGGALEGMFSVPGTLSVGTVSVAAGAVNYTAGGDILIGTLIVPGTGVSLAANGLVSLDQLTTASGLSVTANALILNTVATTGSVGADIGTNASLGQISADGDILVDAGGAITAIDLSAAGILGLNGALIAIGDANAATIDLTSASDILFDSLTSPNGIDLSAVNGTIAANTGAGNIDSGGDVTLLGQSIDLGEIVSGGSADASATAGDASFTAVNAANDITISASGTPTIGSATSGGNTSITGAEVTFNNGSVGGDLSLTATGGDIDGNGTVTVGGGITFDANGNVSFGTLDATGGAFEVDAGGIIRFTSAGATDLIRMHAGTLIQGGSLNAGTDVDLISVDVAVDDIVAGGNVSALADGGSLIFGSLDSGGSITLDAVGEVLASHAQAAGDFSSISGGNFTTGLNSIITGGDIIISGNVINLGNSNAGGLVDVTGTQIDFVELIAGQTIDLKATSTQTGGNGNITGVDITAGNGASRLAALGAITLSGQTTIGGSLSMDAGGAIALNLTDVNGGDFIATAGDGISFANAQAAGVIDFLAGTSINAAGDLTGGAGVLLEAQDGEVAIRDITAGDLIDIVATGDVTAAALDAGAAIDIASGGTVSLGSVSAGTGPTSAITITGDMGIDINTLTGSVATLTSTGGSVSVDTDIDLTGILAAQATDVFLRSTHDLAVQASASAGDIDVEAAGNLDVQGASAAGDIGLTSTGGNTTLSQDVDAGGNLQVDAAALVDIQALATGAAIDISSADIAVGSAGAIGQSDRTTAINFTANADEVTLGGTGGSVTNYELDNDEFSRVFSAGDISVTAIGTTSTGAFVTIDDLDVTTSDGSSAASGNIGQSGSLSVFGRDMLVAGALSVTGTTADNSLILGVEGLLEVDYAAGNLRMEDSSGALVGNLNLSAGAIEAISAAARTDISGASLEDIDIRLGQNDGTVRGEGFFQAGAISFEAETGILIQNTGAGTDFADRRGFVADSVSVTGTSSTSPLDIVINGTVAGETGLDALGLVDLTNATPAAASTINGCIIANPASCIPAPVNPTSGPSENPIRELVEEQVEAESPAGTDPILSMIIEFREDPERAPDPLIDEPVTGAGNEDLWRADESAEQGGCTQADPELCPAE